jgi:hypothetical protein
MGKNKNGKCVYCLKDVNNITKEHVPPKCITPSADRKYSLSVPACCECNNILSKEDEYFKTTMLIGQNVSKQERLKEIYPKLFRGLNRVNKFTNDFLKGMQKIRVPIGDNEFEDKLIYTVDWHRITNFFIKIARGLYYLECKNYIPLEYLQISLDLNDVRHTIEQRLAFQIVMRDILNLDFKYQTGIVKYRYIVYPEDYKYHSIWNIILFDQMNFLVGFSRKYIVSN